MAGSALGSIRSAGLWGILCLSCLIAVLSGWVLGSSIVQGADPVLEQDGQHPQSNESSSDPLSALPQASGIALQRDAVALEGASPRSNEMSGTDWSPSWRVVWVQDSQDLFPHREDYSELPSGVRAKRPIFEIREDEGRLRRIQIVGVNGVRTLIPRPTGAIQEVRLQLVDRQGVPVQADAMLVDERGVPWGPIDSEEIGLPMGWRGFVLARGFASAPLQIRGSGRMRVGLHHETTVVVRVSSEGLDLVGSRLFLRIFGANVGPSPGRIVRLEGKSEVWLRGLQQGQILNVELMSELGRFDIVRNQIDLKKAVHELTIVARAFSEARLVTSDPDLVGQRLYVAPFFAKDPEDRTSDFRYPWRIVEWDGSGWPLHRLRAGELAFWIWTDEGRFGRLGSSRFLPGSPGIEFPVHLEQARSASLAVPTPPLLAGRKVEVILLDQSYAGHPENLLSLKRRMPGMRIKTWKIEAGKTLQMRGLWKRRSRIVVRSEEGATLWEGQVDLDTKSRAHLSPVLAIGGLVPWQNGTEVGQRTVRVYAKKSGEVVEYPARAKAAGRALLLRKGEYELRGPGQTTRTIHIVAGRVTKF